MKTINKTAFFLFLLTAFAGTTLLSCQKYPDGPPISFRSRASRLANDWRVENYKINNVDFTSLSENYSETFTKSGEYSYSWGILNAHGTWKFQHKDEQVQLNGNDFQTSRTLFIQKLEDKALWYYYIEGNDKYELHLIAK